MTLLIGIATPNQEHATLAMQHIEHRWHLKGSSFDAPIKSGIAAALSISPAYFEGPNADLPIPVMGMTPAQMVAGIRAGAKTELWARVIEAQIHQGKLHALDKRGMVIAVSCETEASMVRRLGGFIFQIYTADDEQPVVLRATYHKSDFTVSVPALLDEFKRSLDLCIAEAAMAKLCDRESALQG